MGKWFNGNLLSLNTDKPNFICFGTRNQNRNHFNSVTLQDSDCFTEHCSCLKKNTETKYRGLIIDDKLNEEHVLPS